jgi:bile acid-coenzyme A ligase
MYHNIPFGWTYLGLFEGQKVIVMERFDAEQVIDLVERHRVEYMIIVPTMMRRIAAVPGVERRDWSSIGAFMHSGAPCPAPVKRAWIDLVGAEKVFEGFGAAEGNGIAMIRGDEWLEHPGSVGRPFRSRIRIVGDDGSELGPGEVGEIFMGTETPAHTYSYVGAPPAKTTEDGLVSVGDLGWVDEDGYVYLADRRTDLIITGGANVYPAEVEHALIEHPAVSDAAVVGIPDEDWGKRVHAIVQPHDQVCPPSEDELTAHCRTRLAPYKCPKTYEFVDRLLHDEAGKMRRSQLAAERS